MNDDIAISVRDLGKCYQLYDKPIDRLKQVFAGHRRRYFEEFWALRDVSFDIARGESVGIIGKNGSGKSTLLQLIAGTLVPSLGKVSVNGRITALLELGSGFNPEFTGRENVYHNASILGIPSSDMQKRFGEIVNFADIGDFIDRPVKTYSSGMLLRLAFATQTALEPKILIVDEALAVGDMTFQVKCFARMNELREQGTTILFVSHNLGSVLSFCDRALYLQGGRQIALGPSAPVARQYEMDCLAAKMTTPTPKPTTEPIVTPAPELLDRPHDHDVLVKLAKRYAGGFQKYAAQAGRSGSGRVTIESFVLTRADGSPLESVLPTDEINGCFLLAFNSRFKGQIHLSIQIIDKCGTPLMIVRDSYFEQAVSGVPGSNWFGLMRFRLPLMAGVYYGKLGVLLYPDAEKYAAGQHNFDDAEISDLIEVGAVFEVLSFERHPIHFPVLNEAALVLTPVSATELDPGNDS